MYDNKMEKFLENIASDMALETSKYEQQAFIINMHALPSVIKLLKVLLDSGVKAENILFIGKPYSTIVLAQQELCGLGMAFASVPGKFKSGTLVLEHTRLLEDTIPAF